MRIAVDTSVLLCVLNDESGAEGWLDTLVECRRLGQLLISEVVYAELAAGYSRQSTLDAVCNDLGLRFEAISRDAAWLAGKTFRAYRTSGGPREHLIPDFLIAAHALVQADKLAAIDRGYLRRYFPRLAVL